MAGQGPGLWGAVRELSVEEKAELGEGLPRHPLLPLLPKLGAILPYAQSTWGSGA